MEAEGCKFRDYRVPAFHATSPQGERVYPLVHRASGLLGPSAHARASQLVTDIAKRMILSS
eukprot:3416962-Amphidinium_carterae.1